MEEVTLAEEAAVGSLISLGTVISCLSASEKYAMELGLLGYADSQDKGVNRQEQHCGHCRLFPTNVRRIASYRCDRLL
jgi:hypothetical protein